MPFKKKEKAPVEADVPVEEVQKLSTDGELVDIWERRLLNPNQASTPPIRIKTPGQYLRWMNLASSAGRYNRATQQQGWRPVHKTELTDEREVFGATYSPEGWVCRGQKSSEMLMKIPVGVWKQICQRKDELNKASYKKLKAQLTSAGYDHFKQKYGGAAGDQAAEVSSRFVGEVSWGTEKVTSEEVFD